MITRVPCGFTNSISSEFRVSNTTPPSESSIITSTMVLVSSFEMSRVIETTRIFIGAPCFCDQP